ncbi:hypothetical protein C8F04DRAFT_1076988 [Mycena alexandri]|uniref:Uncharacterized protein n=1 Tax=Mycena alexandri TaxID=1745969 RepID=A0AAD6TDX6_9AGAR|nr:hypothetical protein C8F04DRAFT_1076988 [Mycena alexandri]
MHSPPPNMHDLNSFRSIYQTEESVPSVDMAYESTSSVQPIIFGFDGSVGRTEYSADFTNLSLAHRFRGPSYSGVTCALAHRREEFTDHGGGSVGARYCHAHDSINDGFFPAASSSCPVGGDLSRTHSMVDEDMFIAQPQPVVFGSSQPGTPATAEIPARSRTITVHHTILWTPEGQHEPSPLHNRCGPAHLYQSARRVASNSHRRFSHKISST